MQLPTIREAEFHRLAKICTAGNENSYQMEFYAGPKNFGSSLDGARLLWCPLIGCDYMKQVLSVRSNERLCLPPEVWQRRLSSFKIEA
jgi:hypothetical protein